MKLSVKDKVFLVLKYIVAGDFYHTVSLSSFVAVFKLI